MSCKGCDNLKTPFCPECGRPRVKLPKDEILAETLHKLFCHANHIDGCSWEYEIGWAAGTVHYSYLVVARKIQEQHSDEAIVDMLSMVNLIKGI